METARHTPATSGPVETLMRPLVSAIDASVQAEIREQPFQRDPDTLQRLLPLTKAINRYFGVEIRGWENLPRHRAALIVGNHSGGAQTMDVAPLIERWIDDRGPQTPLYMLGYDLLLAFPVLGRLFRKLGLLRANPVLAAQTLKRGFTVVVFPGGDHEVFRPWSERNKIDFGGRTGFIQLALATGVPVVPMTIHGAHESTIVLTRGRALAQAMGLDRLHIKVFPFILNVPFGVTPAFIPTVPLPAKITVEFGKPLDWSRYGSGNAKDPAIMQRCYAEITGAMQRTLDTLASERPYPVLARLDELRPSRVLRRLLGGGPAEPSVGAARALSRPRPQVRELRPIGRRRRVAVPAVARRVTAPALARSAARRR
ncbi:MAG TPA: lysophospholipid acyltransferase family protein [Candidatus Acidoferrales bacterium]|nr:lysophospholipid acyltransferase family protein [Candidatus Acidoferrales bacterium]